MHQKFIATICCGDVRLHFGFWRWSAKFNAVWWFCRDSVSNEKCLKNKKTGSNCLQPPSEPRFWVFFPSLNPMFIFSGPKILGSENLFQQFFFFVFGTSNKKKLKNVTESTSIKRRFFVLLVTRDFSRKIKVKWYFLVTRDSVFYARDPYKNFLSITVLVFI